MNFVKILIYFIFQLCLIPFRCLAWFLFTSPKPRRRKSYYVKKHPHGRPVKHKPYKQPRPKYTEMKTLYTTKSGKIIRNSNGTPKYKRKRIKLN